MYAVKTCEGDGGYVIDNFPGQFADGIYLFEDMIECNHYCMDLQDGEKLSCYIEEVELIPTNELTRLRLADAFIEAFVKMTTLSNTPVFAGDYKQAQDAIRAYRAHVEKEQTDANT